MCAGLCVKEVSITVLRVYEIPKNTLLCRIDVKMVLGMRNEVRVVSVYSAVYQCTCNPRVPASLRTAFMSCHIINVSSLSTA